MAEPKGVTIPISVPRRLIIDLLHFSRQIPTLPLCRRINVGALEDYRKAHPSRPSWSLLFMKAYALVMLENPPLRRSWLACPWPRLYEHPRSHCALAIERSIAGEDGVFFGLFRAPESQSISELQKALNRFKSQPLDEVGFFRRALRISRLPLTIRRFLWWTSLNLSGPARAKRFGTFGLTALGGLGAESIHPLSPLTTTLTFGPIDAEGWVNVKLVYDHRILDGAYIARRLADLEARLNTVILDELKLAQGLRVDEPGKETGPHLGTARPGGVEVPESGRA